MDLLRPAGPGGHSEAVAVGSEAPAPTAWTRSLSPTRSQESSRLGKRATGPGPEETWSRLIRLPSNGPTFPRAVPDCQWGYRPGIMIGGQCHWAKFGFRTLT